jgi:peptidoglycan/xylan/chitin deacetylase (PgdA/CDA1 family)
MTMARRSFLAAAAAVVLESCSKGARRLAAAPARSTTTSTPAAGGATASTATTATSAATGGPARFVTSGPASSKAVALTFHGSGDVTLLHRLLDALAAGHAPATIFAVGNWLDANPAVARTILDAGHELANHTFTHPVLPRLDRARTAAEITGCRDSLVRHAGAPGRWFRPSGTPTPTPLILEEAARAGYGTVVGYDVDTLDYQDPGADAVTKAAVAGLHAGAILSLHTGHAGTVTALPAILSALGDRGLRPVVVSDLLR